jgi:hypothetical protein
MPIGNGDIGLNVWTEPGGDVVFYIGKTDAWTEDPAGNTGLAKLGRVRVSMAPNPFVPGVPLFQELRLHEAEIEIRGGSGADRATLRIWVDANHPVIHVEENGSRPVSLKASLEVWRTTPVGKLGADTVLPSQGDQITWFHHNGPGSDPHVLDWTFGASLQGAGLRAQDSRTLVSARPSLSNAFFITPLTTPASTPQAWLERLQRQADGLGGLDLEAARREHRRWWDRFWRRSWIFLSGGEKARETGEGYILQRFVTACSGRGAYPVKFNGSIFVVDQPAENLGGKPPVIGPVTADYRMWGGRYWFQNTRAMYWPRLMAGDFDEMAPLFRMYLRMLPANASLVRQYYHHDGAYCAECAPFWGGLPDLSHNGKGYYGDNYYTDLLELSMMGLDYYEYTGDTAFLRETVLPIAGSILTFFDRHFPRDRDGRLILDPDNAIETYWKVRNPAPDIAGLHAVLGRLLALPGPLVAAPTRGEWERIRAALPDLPTGFSHGRRVLLPYGGEQTATVYNSENPELYAIYPFRLYGLGKPGLDLARDTFASRRVQRAGCWVQDPIQAALLGFTDLARKDVAFDLTRRDPALKFPAFWERGNDYMPDEDNGGNGENGLQQMLLQAEGRKILLMPAWPREWNADFKLNAPRQTTIEGRVRAGRLLGLVVTPRERIEDIQLPGGQTLPRPPNR